MGEAEVLKGHDTHGPQPAWWKWGEDTQDFKPPAQSPAMLVAGSRDLQTPKWGLAKQSSK